MSKPEIIAHRGSRVRYPENTIPAFLDAIAAGADAIELDVHGTRDGQLVVHHDAHLPVRLPGRTAAGLLIADSTLLEIRAYVLAQKVGIPTLPDVLSAVGHLVATVYVEVKAAGVEEQTVSCIRQSGANCAVHSFDHRVVRRVQQLAPDIPVGVLSASYLLDPVAALRAAGARDYWQQADLCDAALVRAISEAGGRVIAWTVNDLALARQLIQAGVSGLCTDDVPALLGM